MVLNCARTMSIAAHLAARFPTRLRKPVLNGADSILRGLTLLRSPGRFIATGLLSLAVWIVPILFVAGVLIGYGSKVAGGCTSGNGLSGTSALSPASLAATATFFAVAIVVSFVTKALT